MRTTDSMQGDSTVPSGELNEAQRIHVREIEAAEDTIDLRQVGEAV
jgi:hypothetical protein